MPRVIACFKYSIDASELRIDPSTRKPVVEGAKRKTGDIDKRAIEEAIRVKERTGWTATGLCVGPQAAREAAREALAMGLDEVYILSDPAFEGSDTLATARLLAAAARKLGDYKLILCGEMALDGLSAQVGPRLAELLDLPQVTYVRKLSVEGEKLTAERDLEEEYEVVEVELPAVVTVTREINEPRLPSLRDILRASKKPIVYWGAGDLEVGADVVGEKGSKVKVADVYAPEVKRKGVIIEEKPAEEAAEELVKYLLQEGVLR